MAEDGPREIEEALRAAVDRGEALDLSSGDPALDDPSSGSEWGKERSVSAGFIMDLAKEHIRHGLGHGKLWLKGVRLAGVLDLEGLNLPWPVVLEGCYVEGRPSLRETKIISLRVSRCHFEEGLNGCGVRIFGDLEMVDTEVHGGDLDLSRGLVEGDLNCTGSRFKNAGSEAICADELTVRHDVLFRDGFEAEGEISLTAARVEGQLICNGARMEADGETLSLDGARIEGGIFLRDGFVSCGTVRLGGCRVGGALSCEGAQLRVPEGSALLAHGLIVEGSVFLDQKFHAQGRVLLSGARVAGNLICTDSTFENPGKIALSAEQLAVDGMVLLGDGFLAQGQVVLSGAHFRGQLQCTGGRFANPNGKAITADRITVDNSVSCGEGFVATGSVTMPGARIAGQVSCVGSKFLNAGSVALSLEGSTIGGGLFFSDGFIALGLVRLVRAEVSVVVSMEESYFDEPEQFALLADGMTVRGDVMCMGASVSTGSVSYQSIRVSGLMRINGSLVALSEAMPGTLSLRGSRVEQDLRLEPVWPFSGKVDLSNATVGTLVENDDAWIGGYELQGLRYERLSVSESEETIDHAPVTQLDRHLKWVRKNASGYHPQIYGELARAYRGAGHEDLQRRVLIEKQRRRRDQFGLTGRLWSLVQDALVGFGYRTWRAIAPLGILILAGSLFFAAHRGDFLQKVPAQKPPPFQPLAYTLDLVLPVVNLGQQESWIPHHASQSIASVLALLGWVLTTAILAALAAAVIRPVD